MSKQLARLVAEVRALRSEVRELIARTAPTAPAVPIDVAASLLGCSRKQVYRLIQRRHLTRARSAGRRTMIATESILRFQEPPPALKPKASIAAVPQRSPRGWSAAEAEQHLAAIKALRV